jgi:hypothetical protein
MPKSKPMPKPPRAPCRKLRGQGSAKKNAAKAPRKIAKKLSVESLAKRLRGQGSAKKPCKKAPRQRLRGKGSAKKLAAKAPRKPKAREKPKAQRKLRRISAESSQNAPRKTLVMFDGILSMLRKLV